MKSTFNFIVVIAIGIFVIRWLAPPRTTKRPMTINGIEEVINNQVAPQKRVQKYEKLNSVKKSLPRLPPKVTTLKTLAPLPKQKKDFAHFDQKGNLHLTQVVIVNDLLTYHGDLVIGKAEDLEKMQKSGKPLTVPPPQKWPNGKVPFEVSLDVTQEDDIAAAIEILNEQTNITFTPRDSEKDYVLITTGEASCFSNLGRVGGQQHIYLSAQCRQREIIHEFLHTLGFFHEQNREDRDKYLKVYWENISEEYHMQFKKFPNSYIRANNYSFDYASIMLYHSTAFSIDGQNPSMTRPAGETLGVNTELSTLDIQKINDTYPQ